MMESHPPDTHIQRYLDGELDSDVRQSVARHMITCDPCRAKLKRYVRVRRQVHAAAPTWAEFRPEGEFWTCLVARLPPRPRPRWPFVPYVPPILLGIPGTLLEGVISLLFVLRLLVGVGLLPSVGSAIADRLIPLLGHPLLEASLYSLVGWSGEKVVASALSSWNRMSVATQDALVLALALLLSAALFFGVAVLYIGWAVCWSGATPSDPKRRQVSWSTEG